MHSAIIGSGPVGMTAALLLARQGHDVTLNDRDPGPLPGRAWERVGVMQFNLPHGFRAQVRNLLLTRLPDVHQALIDAGAEIVVPEGAPEVAAMLHIRRALFERILWEIVSAEPRVTRVTGHVDGIEVADGVATGVIVDAGFLAADLVIDAGGRLGRTSAAYRPEGTRVDCGMSYATRQYRLLPGALPGPTNGGPGYVTEHDGFVSFVFAHDDGHFMVLIVRANADSDLADLRHEAAFEAACRILPGVAEWTDPERSRAVDVVRAGAGLVNAYRSQATDVVGLLAIGDAFCTTNPQGARGVPLGMQTAAFVEDLVESRPRDMWAGDLDAWGQAHLEPWYVDHLAWDHTQVRRWAGEALDPEGPIGLDVIGAAAEEHPEFRQTLAPFWGMFVGPDALAPLRERVREMLRAGWQPPSPGGVTRADLVTAIRSARDVAA